MQVLKVLPKSLQFPEQHTILALTGSGYSITNPYVAQTASDTSLNIQADPTSDLVSVDSNILLHMQFSITVTGTNSSDQPLLLPGHFGPSFLPIRQIISSETLTINGVVSNLGSLNSYFPALIQSYQSNDWESIHREWSLTPSFPDKSTQFLYGALAVTSIQNPLASSTDQTQYPSRSTFPGFVIVSNPHGGTTATMTLDVTEPLVVSPLKFGSDSFYATPMTNIKTLNYNCVFSNLNRIFSLSYPLVGGGITSGGVPTITAPDASGTIAITNVTCHVTFAELRIGQRSMWQDVPRPIKQILPYNQVNYFASNAGSGGSVAPGGTVTLTSQSQSLSSIPRYLYVWIPIIPDNIVQQSGNPAACTVPVSFMSWGGGAWAGNSDFQPISINFDTTTQLQSLSMGDLYKMQVKNGYSGTFNDFVGMPLQSPGTSGTGTICKFVFGEDIVLNPGTVVGQSGRYTLTITVKGYNQSQWTLPYAVLDYAVVYDGITEITSNGIASLNQATFDSSMVSQIPFDPAFRYNPDRSIIGGSFWDSVKGFFGKVHDFVKENRILSSAASLIPKVGPLLGPAVHAIGYGCQNCGGGGCNMCIKGGGMRYKPGRRMMAGGGYSDIDERKT